MSIPNKSMLSFAVGAALGVATFGAHAAAVVSWDLQDFDNDGRRSDLAFFSPPSGNSLFVFGDAGEMCGSEMCAPIAFGSGAIGVDVFTTGFDFDGTGDFKLNVTGNMAADITGGALVFSALDLGGKYFSTLPSPSEFFLKPDDFGAILVETLTDLGANRWGVVIRYKSTVVDPPSVWDDFEFNLRLEGVMTTVPLPGAAWLLGAGLAGLFGFARRRDLVRTGNR